MNDEATDELMRMGLTEYQSKVYVALAALGPSGVSDINRLSKVPRTKIYQTLEELILKGAIEFQPGRPVVYHVVLPSILIKRMTDAYLESAKKAETLLQEHYESVTDSAQDLVWFVRGDGTIRRKLAELTISAKKSIFTIESYPPFFTRSVNSLLKAALKNGLKVRAVCIAQKDNLRNESGSETDLIKYRTFLSAFKKKAESDKNGEDEQLLKSLGMAISSPYCLVVIDDLESFVVIRNSTDKARSTGFSAKIPGVSILQRVMFEKLIAERTSQYSRG